MSVPDTLAPSAASARSGRRFPAIVGAIVLAAAVRWLAAHFGELRVGEATYFVLEGIGCSLALLAGALALLVRYRGLGEMPVLLTGVGILGAGALDAVHVLVISSPPSAVASRLLTGEWSWFASRLYLAVFLVLGASRSFRSATRMSDRALLRGAGLLLLAGFLPFLAATGAAIALPWRPLLGVALAGAFLGLLRHGAWRRDSVELSLVLATVFWFFASGPFASPPRGSPDLEAAVSSLLESAACFSVLAGLAIDLLQRFRLTESIGAEARRRNEALSADLAEGVRVEQELRRLGETLEERVTQRTLDLEASRLEAMEALAVSRKSKFEAQAAERRFRDVLEWAVDPMVITDGSGRITMVNAAAETLFGYEKPELIGQEIESILPVNGGASSPSSPSRFTVEPPSPDGTGRTELRARRKDESQVPVEVSLNAIESLGGPLISCVVKDLTERKQAEAKIARYTRDLERSNAELEQFAYVASHDLLEPLRMVSSFAQLLARRYRGKLDATADEYIAQLVDGARRMQDLIRDLLRYSRVGVRDRPSDAVACDEVLAAVLGNLQVVIRESGALVIREPLPLVRADRTELGQLFQNLVANAIKFRAADPPRVQVGADREDGHWVFRVRDNGVGIDPGNGERIFEIFRRLHPRDKYPGTGIGLAICKRIVERNGGRIWVESRPRQGTVVYFTLPVAPVPPS